MRLQRRPSLLVVSTPKRCAGAWLRITAEENYYLTLGLCRGQCGVRSFRDAEVHPEEHNKKLLGTSASLLVTSALLVVTRSY